MTNMLITKETSSEINTDTNARRSAISCFLAALILIVGVYVSVLFHLLEEPLFSRIYYGNLNSTFFSMLSAIYIFTFVAIFHKKVKHRLGLSPFGKKDVPLSLSRKAILYFMTVIPILLCAILLGFHFKLIYELGERITGMTLLGNAVGYIYVVAKLFCVIYVIFLVESGCDRLFSRKVSFPYGGLVAMLTFGLCELCFTQSAFLWLYMALFFYYGILYLVSNRKFGVSYALAIVLYIL